VIVIPSDQYARMTDEQKHMHNLLLVHQLERFKRHEPEIAREAAAITNTLFTNKPDLNAPKATVEAYAALCIYQKHHPWLPPQIFARLKTWLNYAGAEIDRPNHTTCR